MRRSLSTLLCVPMLAIGLLAFTAGDAASIGREMEPTKLIGPIRTQDVALLMFLSASALAGEFSLGSFLRPPSIAFLGVLAAFTLIGIFNKNNLFYVAEDIRVWLWVLGGAAFFRALAARKCAVGGLCAAALVFGLIMHLGTTHPMQVDQVSHGSERAYDAHLFNYSLLLSIIAPLLLILGALRSWVWITVAGSLILLIIYDGVVLGATRSIAISVGAMHALIVPSLWKLSLTLPEKLRARSRLRLTAVGLLLSCTLLLPICCGRILGAGSAIAGRFSGSRETQASNEGRILEAQGMVRGLSSEEWLMGRGLGGQARAVGSYITTFALHFGVLTFLLKGGVVMLIAAFMTLFVVLPLRYAIACLRRSNNVTDRDIGIICVMPGLAAWLAMLTISGGYSVYASFGVGVCAAAWSAPGFQGDGGLDSAAVYASGQGSKESLGRAAPAHRHLRSSRLRPAPYLRRRPRARPLRRPPRRLS